MSSYGTLLICMHVFGMLCLVLQNVYWIGLCRFLMLMLNLGFHLFPFFFFGEDQHGVTWHLNNPMYAFAIFTHKHFASELFCMLSLCCLQIHHISPTPNLHFMCMCIYLLVFFELVSYALLVSRLCLVFLHSVKHG